jgi:hypothetical protein
MTSYSDQVKLGGAYYNRATASTSGGYIIGYDEDEIRGVPIAPIFPYLIGLASTALASGIFYSASGATGGTLTATGALVSSGVATLDQARCIRFTSTVDTSTSVITVVGTDMYGAGLAVSISGPTGNTLGNVGSYRDTLSAFKTVTSASAVGNLGTTSFQIGTSNTFGLPYRLSSVGRALDVYIDGSSATIPATWTVGLSTAVTPTASTADVRGTVAISTTVLPNDARFYTAVMISPAFNVAKSDNTKEITYGVTPFSA